MADSVHSTPLPAEGTASNVHELGRWLGAIIAESRRTDAQHRVPAVEARERANDMVREAIEHLVLSTKAATPADAAVHALFIRRLADDVDAALQDGNEPAARQGLWALERLGRSIFDVLTSASGIDPAELCADFYMRDAATLWPPTVVGDLFAATAGLLEAEAGRLVLPAEPTPDMIEAGASAAGIGAELARKVWDAMAGVARPAGA